MTKGHRPRTALSRLLVLGVCGAALWAARGCGREDAPPPSAPLPTAPATTAPDGGASAAWVQPELAPDGIELANGQAGPSFIAIDDQFVYWTNFQDDGVLKIDKRSGGKPVVVARTDHGDNKDIAVDDTAVYWGGASLHQQLKATGAIRVLGTSTMIYNLVPLSGRIYWADGGQTTIQARSLKADGTDPRAVGPADTKDFTFAIDEAAAYVGRLDLEADDEGRIDVVRTTGGAPAPFAKTRFIWKVALDEEFVYWLEGRTTGAIKKKARSGDAAELTLTEGVPIRGPQSLVADGDALYWTELGVTAGQGAVGKVGKAGGDAHLVAKNQVVPQDLAVDDAFVYWVNFGPTKNGTVRKAAKQALAP